MSYPGETGATSYSVTQLLDLAVVRDSSATPNPTFTVYTRSSSGAFTKEYEIDDLNGDSIPAIESGNTILGFFGEDGNAFEAIQAGKVFDLRFWHGIALSEAQLNEQFAEIYTVTSTPSSTLTALPATGGDISTNLIFVISCVLVLAGLTTILASRKNRIRS